MYKSLTTIIIIISIVFSSCKKKDTTEPDTQKTISSTSNTSVSSYSGFMVLSKFVVWESGAPSIGWGETYNSYPTTLYPNPVSGNYLLGSTDAGTITINGNLLAFDNSLHSYYDGGTPNYSQQRLITLNSTVLPSFTVAVTDTFPKYSIVNGALIPDTIALTNDLIIPLNNLTYYDLVECNLSKPGPILNYKYKSSAVLTNQLTFTPADLSTFAVGDTLQCRVIFKKYNTQVIGGKTFRFELQTHNFFGMLVQ